MRELSGCYRGKELKKEFGGCKKVCKQNPMFKINGCTGNYKYH